MNKGVATHSTSSAEFKKHLPAISN